jgi:Phosphotransferase enzyme family
MVTVGLDQPEIPLGGTKALGVVRVGDTVRRRVGPWSPVVHGLLRHLESVGFDGAPRFIGIDDSGREILSFHPGVRISDEPDLAEDDVLADVARLVRGFHDASTGFVPPPGAPRWEGSVDPEGGSLVLHGDLAPWNVIVGAGRLTLIDWDDVWVGRVEWEIAYVLQTFVPLWPDALSDHDTVRRIRLFAGAYGLSGSVLRAAIDLVPARCRAMGESNRLRAAMGNQAFVRAVAQGIDNHWLSSAAHVATRLPTWRRHLAI